MSSGHGLYGGRPPCFVFWQEFSKCYAGTADPKECQLPKEDYLECLHHTKEFARAAAIREQYVKNLHHEGKSQKEIAQAIKSGIAASVGLIEGEGYESK